MWLVSSLLWDRWFDDFAEAYTFWQASPTTRTRPVLDAEWNAKMCDGMVLP